MGKKGLYFIIILLGYLTLYVSCANMGMPTGGPKDTVPPVLLRSIPALNATNFNEKKLRLYFNEFVIPEEISEKFIVSPPVEKRPIVRTKGKSIVVDLNNELKDSTTYSLDFKDAIRDNNEKNPLKDFRIAFSTGPELDSLRLTGYVKNAFNLEPVEGAIIFLYRNLSDTIVYKAKPDYIAKTNEEGFFAVTNIGAGTYQVFAVTDLDNNLMLASGAEPVAFLDSTITPYASFSELQDTTVQGLDTLVIYGKTRFYPDPVYFMQFEEDYFDLRVEDYQRSTRRNIDLIFTQSVKDTFDMELLNIETEKEWMYLEHSANYDTLKVWLTDSMVYKRDTINLRLTYNEMDSLGNFVPKNDTIRLFFSDAPKSKKAKRSKRRKIVQKPVSVDIATNTKSKGFDIYRNVILTLPEPIERFDKEMVHLYQQQDTIFNPIDFEFYEHETNKRKYILSHPWEFTQTYKLEIDSAAATTIYDLPSTGYESIFAIQDEEHYGKIKFDLQNVTVPTVIQLLKNTEEEVVLQSLSVDKDGLVEFPYLEPQKYMVKAFFDRNNNGKWDTGDLDKKRQPEEVVYFPEIIRVRSNWDSAQSWKLPTQQIYDKKIIDKEMEEEKAKAKRRSRQVR